ncbi:biotin holocarboxylase synthetase [Coemansia sp. BCRC 34301]|nr:biotin holocarboxylase synthetase [Coemansia sp. BCRC 34301]
MVLLNVLVYSGPGIGPESYAYLVRTLRQFLSHRYAIIPVEPETLRKEPWESKAAMLVMPGGRDLPYVAAMKGEINQRIRRWVEAGGRYLGFCAGGYYGSARCEFEPETPLEVVGDRELALFPGTCLGCAYPGYSYKTEDGARAAEVTVNKSAFGVSELAWKSDPDRVRIYYNGGGYFVTDGLLGKKPADSSVSVLVSYASDVSDPYDRSRRVANAPAIVSCKVGSGVAVLSGLHPEYAWDFLAPSSYTQTHNQQLVSLLRSHDAYRRRLLGAIFTHMHIEVDSEALLDDVATQHSMRIPAATPTFIAPARVSGVAAVAAAMYALNSAATTRGEIRVSGVSDMVLQDANDIHITNACSGDGCRRVPREYQQAVFTPLSPGAAAVRDGALLANGDEGPSPSMLVLCTQDTLPGAKETPRFDMGLAIKYMQEAKAHTAGSWLMYSDTTGSTQTFLEKNTKLQALLPNGTVNVATVQLAGRGRGRNAWVSPVGCLQFTMVLRHPNLKQAPVVMLQYLIALAVVESIKCQPGYEGIPLRLKWPNDLYAALPSSDACADSSDGSDGSEACFVKIGGVLVSSSFKANEFTLLFGCGVNVANALPTTSINKLIHQHNLRTGSRLAPICMEKALALVTAKFEEYYRQFLLHGFEPNTLLEAGPWVLHGKTRLSWEVVLEDHKFPEWSFPLDLAPYLRVGKKRGRKQRPYIPLVWENPIAARAKHWVPLTNQASVSQDVPLDAATIEVDVSLSGVILGWFRLCNYAHQGLSELSSPRALIRHSESDVDNLREMVYEVNPTMLGITIVAMTFHMLFEFLAYKEDVSFWSGKNKANLQGISRSSMLMSFVSSFISLFYLYDRRKDTNIVVLVGAAAGALVEAWKLTKVLSIGDLLLLLPFARAAKKPLPKDPVEESSDAVLRNKVQREVDQQMAWYMVRVCVPAMIAYAAFSLVFLTHSSYVSWFLHVSLASVYSLEFIQMWPQLLINHKLKTVDMLPLTAFLYRFLLTFIDDLYALVVPMPLIERIGTLRDDVVFIVLCYQWIKFPRRKAEKVKAD